MGNCCTLQRRTSVATSAQEQRPIIQAPRQYESFTPVRPTVYLPHRQSQGQFKPLQIADYRPIPADQERNPVVRKLQNEQRNQLQERKTPVISVSKSTSKRIEINPVIIKDFLGVVGHESWNNYVDNDRVCDLDSLAPGSSEFNEVKEAFTKTNKKFYKIIDIWKVINPYLLMQYKLMEDLYKQRYGYVSEKMMFHGTSVDNIEDICTYNFNWRLNGEHRGHTFGKGVSFTPIAYFATHYSDKLLDKFMIVTRVLISKYHVGNNSTVLPISNYDATINKDGQVFVKYEDNTFYPSYVIHYQGTDWKS